MDKVLMINFKHAKQENVTKNMYLQQKQPV